MKKTITTRKISMKLFILLCILFIVLTGTLLNYTGIDSLYMRNTLPGFLTVIGIFIVSFLLIVNRKINYLNYIAERVKKMAHEDLGSTIEIRGNDELAQLGSSINIMSQQLKYRSDKEKVIEKAKDELITNVSHDLRTPLTSIIGYADLLRRSEYASEEQMREYVDTIYHKSLNLQQLIHELFEYTRLAVPGMIIDTAKVNLSGLLEQLVGEYVPIFHKGDLVVSRDIPEDIYVEADVEKIVRVFENILMNAIKYSLKPSKVQVKLVCEQSKAIVSISNKADRATAGKLDLLFEKFYRADASRQDADGAGLGLAIAKRIIELHGGRIWAEYLEDTIWFNVQLNRALPLAAEGETI